MRHTARAAVLAVGLLLPVPSFAAAVQYKGPVTLDNGQTQTTTIDVTPSTPLPVTGSISASLAGFTPAAGATANLAVTTTSADVTLPAGADIVVTNTGTVDVRGRIQTGAGTAVTTDQIIKAGAAVGWHITTQTHLSAITASGSSNLNIQGGAGLASGYGGAGAAGGDATAANQTTGNTSLATIATNTTGAATAAAQATGNASLATIATAAQAGTSTTGSAAPASAVYMGANSAGNLTGVIQADSSVKLDMSTATTTQLVALSSSKKIYITAWDVVAAGTGNIKLVYGTGSNCGTGTTDLTGNYNLTAQAGISKGSGLGPVVVVPASQALCATTSAAVQMSGSVAYTQF